MRPPTPIVLSAAIITLTFSTPAAWPDAYEIDTENSIFAVITHKALIGAAKAYRGSGIIVPTRNADLFRWCLDHGLRVSFPGTMMSVGFYNEPQGGYLPSNLY